jgi:hypothetical protein
MSQKDHDFIELKKLIREKPELTKLISSTADTLSASVRKVIDGWLESMADHSYVSPRLFESAESECRSDEELSHVLDLEALIHHYSGDTHQAIDKAHKCLTLSSRIGYRAA